MTPVNETAGPCVLLDTGRRRSAGLCRASRRRSGEQRPPGRHAARLRSQHPAGVLPRPQPHTIRSHRARRDERASPSGGTPPAATGCTGPGRSRARPTSSAGRPAASRRSDTSRRERPSGRGPPTARSSPHRFRMRLRSCRRMRGRPARCRSSSGVAVAFYDRRKPTTVYLAFAGSPYEIEVSDPAPGAAIAARAFGPHPSGRVRSASAASRRQTRVTEVQRTLHSRDIRRGQRLCRSPFGHGPSSNKGCRSATNAPQVGRTLGSPGAARARPLALRLAGGRRHHRRHPRARAALPLRGRAVRGAAPRDRLLRRFARPARGRVLDASPPPRPALPPHRAPAAERAPRGVGAAAGRARHLGGDGARARAVRARGGSSSIPPWRCRVWLGDYFTWHVPRGLRRRARPSGVADPHRARLLLRHRPALLVAARPERAAAARLGRPRRLRVRGLRLRRRRSACCSRSCRSPRTRSTCTSRGASGA